MAKKGSSAKARNAQKQEPMVALYGLDEGTPGAMPFAPFCATWEFACALSGLNIWATPLGP